MKSPVSWAFSLICLLLFSTAGSHLAVDVSPYFDNVSGSPAGEFIWYDFGLNGEPYAGPHGPDQFAVGGSGTLDVTPGGMITTTNSYSSVPPAMSGNTVEFEPDTRFVIRAKHTVPGDGELDGQAYNETRFY